MADNLPANVQLDSSQNGSVSFATEVIATIAGLAATEVEGVANMYSGSSGISGILSRGGKDARNLTKGVRVDLGEGKLTVAVSIISDYGFPIPDVAKNIQDNVKKAIETMSGLAVSGVDVHVQGVSFEKENRAATEIETRQRVLLQKQQDGAAIGGEMAPDAPVSASDAFPSPREAEDAGLNPVDADDSGA